MSISVVCPNCSKIINAPESAAGRKGKCPGCKAIIQIPTDDPEALELVTQGPEKASPWAIPVAILVVCFICAAGFIGYLYRWSFTESNSAVVTKPEEQPTKREIQPKPEAPTKLPESPVTNAVEKSVAKKKDEPSVSENLVIPLTFDYLRAMNADLREKRTANEILGERELEKRKEELKKHIGEQLKWEMVANSIDSRDGITIETTLGTGVVLYRVDHPDDTWMKIPLKDFKGDAATLVRHGPVVVNGTIDHIERKGYIGMIEHIEIFLKDVSAQPK